MDKTTHAEERRMVAEGCPNGLDSGYYYQDMKVITDWDQIYVPVRPAWELECTCLYNCNEVSPNYFEPEFPPITGDIHVE